MWRAYAGAAAVIVGPGLLVASIIGLRLRELATWAAIPALSLAIVFLLGEATMVLHVPFGPPAFGLLVLLLVVLGGLCAVARSRRPALSHDPEHSQHDHGAPDRPRMSDRVEHALLALGVAIGAFTWTRGLRGDPLVPPGGDATRHGWFIARIIFGHTINPSKVLTSDAGGKHPIVNYYPLALHASGALSTRVVGSDVGRVLVAYIVVFGAVVLPIGMFVLARVLAPTRPLVAGFTALVVPMLMLFPYYRIAAGDVPQVVAMALVPVSVVLLQSALLARHPRGQPKRTWIEALVPATLVVLCIAALHTSELPLIIGLPILLVVERAWRKHDARVVRTAAVRGLAVVLLTIALFAPTLVVFARGVSERVPVRPFLPSNTSSGSELSAILQLHYGGGVRQGSLAVLALAGVALLLLRRRPAWVVGWIGVVLLALLANASPNRFADPFTFPWYHLAARVVPNVAFFVPYFAGVTLASGAVLFTRVARRSWAVLPATAVMMALVTQFVGVHAYRSNRAYVHASFDPNPDSLIVFTQAFVSNSSLDAFRWLHVHVARGETVANEPAVDGSLWMYAEQHVVPLIGALNTDIRQVDPELRDRLYLTEHLGSLGRDARADDVARRYRTRWVFFDTHTLGRPVMHLADLRANPHLTVVFHERDAWVFRIDP